MEPLNLLFTEKLGLSEDHTRIFNEHLKLKTLKKGEYLISEGSTCNFIGFAASGTLRSYVSNNEGEFNNDFYFNGDVISAYTSFLTRMPTNCNNGSA